MSACTKVLAHEFEDSSLALLLIPFLSCFVFKPEYLDETVEMGRICIAMPPS